MAAKAQVDSAVIERRLRPIYDCIDNGNNKKAIQEAEKVLKKQPNLHCAKALKALALRRLFRFEEAETLLKELLNEEPDDDATLQAMAISFREFQRPDWTCQAYENAVKKDRNNEEFLSHLFMSYVRLGDYKKQQQTALALYKVRPKNPYYFWAVMSVVMQAYKSEKNLARQVVLPLAERLISKAVEENRLEAEAEVQLYLLVLEMQEKYDRALEVLEGPLGQKLYPLFARERKGEWLMKLERWGAAVNHFKTLITESRDQWAYYTNFVKSILQWPEADHSEAVKFLQTLKQEELSVEGEKKRAPFLAQFLWHEQYQLWTQARQTSNGHHHPAKGDSIVNNFTEYVEIFGSKPCCFSDLKIFLPLLTPEQQGKFLENIRTDTRDTVKELQRHFLYCKLKHYLGLDMPTSGNTDIVEDIRRMYKETREVGEPFLPTDIRPGDLYAILGCYKLLNSDSYVANLPDVIQWLEDVRQTSPSNHYVKMFLVKTYVLAGLGQQATSVYESLDVKYIQQDSMSHLLLYPALFALGQWRQASFFAGNALKFFTTNVREISEYVIAAYKYGSFSKVLEFIKFREKLENSFVLTALTAEDIILHLLNTKDYAQLSQVVQSMEIDFSKDEPCWEKLTDNRDWNLMAVCETQSKETSKALFEGNFCDELRYARLRNRLLHLITRMVTSLTHYPASSSSSQTNGSTPEDHQSSVQQLIRDIQGLVEKPIGARPQYPFAGPLPSRLYAYLGAECPIVITSVVKGLLQLLDLSDESTQRPALTPLFEKLVAYADYRSSGLTCRYEILERLTNASETVILSVLLLSGAVYAAQKNKKAKRRKESTPSISEGMNVIVGEIEPSCQKLITLLVKFKDWTCPSRNGTTEEQEDLPNLDQLSLDDLQTRKAEATSELLAAVHGKVLLLRSFAS